MTHLKNTGSFYNGFELKRIIPLPELQCRLLELIHVETGAKIIHIENDDPENVFCLSFQTLPDSSNGVAHILEHVVLCGSRKFPIKDPFFSMNRRSLNTFMNALTGSDFTCYPAATQNPQDFYNLLEVYLDAVFHPIIDERSFQQEGHRLEFETPSDPQTPLTYRGIVFNEMKGALNSGPARMHEILLKEIFPNLTYGINSGGDPEKIPSLTYQELLHFHEEHYQPSRCLFFFYGNMPLEKHLDFIQEHALKDAKKFPPLAPIPLQPRFSKPKKLIQGYPVHGGESLPGKTLISFGWLTTGVQDQETCLALGVLEVILLDTDASPLKKALLQSGLCKQVTSYIDTDISEAPFAINLKGCEPENADLLEKLIFETLQNIVKKGIPEELIENAIHQYEFHRCEISSDHYPYGLTLFMRCCLLVQHGGTPEPGLIVHALFDSIRKKSDENPHYFTDILKKWLLDNPHFVRITLKPDPELEASELAREKSHLENLKTQLTPTETLKIIEEAEALKAFQITQEEKSLDVLPKIHLSDVPKETRNYSLYHRKEKNFSLYHHECFTNGIGYADIFFDLPELTEKELLYTRVLTTILTQVGCKNQSYEDTLHAIQANTGGVGSYLTFHTQANDQTDFKPAFALRGKALTRKLPDLFSLLFNFLNSPCFSNKQRLAEILQKHYTSLETNFNQTALRYAVNLSLAPLSQTSALSSLWFGLDYFKTAKDLALNFDAHADELIHMLELLVKKIFSQSPFDLVISSEKKAFEFMEKNKFWDISQLKTAPKTPWNCAIVPPSIESQGRIISSPVAYIAKAFNTIPYAHPEAPALSLTSFLFDNLTLHGKIREEGGAYGGGAVSNPLSGNYYFYSYRDPNIASSLNAFEEAIENVLNGNFDHEDLEEAKLEMLQDFDYPISPGSRADVAYNRLKEGKTNELRQNFRNKLISATKQEIIAATHNFILPQFKSAKTIVFAGNELLEVENAKLEAEGKCPLKISPINK